MKRLCAALLLAPALAIAQQGTPDTAERRRPEPQLPISAKPARPQAANPAPVDDSPAGQLLQALKPLYGPSHGGIADKAMIEVPKGYVFFDEAKSRQLLEIMGNPPQNGNYVLAPQSLDWFAVFSFAPVGYVKDNEKIDAEQMLTQLKNSDTRENEERKRLGLNTLHTVGWKVPPHYDPASKRLEWGLAVRSDSGNSIINYTSRILGREGVMKVVLVADDETFYEDTRVFKNTLNGFRYKPGASYADFRSGDKVAQYGLTALVVGGAAAAASKKGLWKLLAGGGALLLAGLGKMLGFFRRS